MKQVVNFRLSNKTNTMLLLLAKKKSLSKTEIVEKAINSYAESALNEKHPLSEFAGILSDKDADDMLHAIRTDKKNKRYKAMF